MRAMATPTFSVFISHVPHGVNKNDVRQIFSQCGVVRDVYVNTLKADHPWTYGFVRFSSLVEALKAVKEMDGWHLKDQRIRVELAKAIDKSCLNGVLSDSKSLPAVDPSLQPPPNQQEVNIDKIVNLNRLQDICCMLNLESNKTTDKIYVDKVLELIEELNCSHKVPAMDTKLSEKAGNCFKSDVTEHVKQLSPSTFDQFTKKHAEVDRTLKNLLYKGHLSSKSAHRQHRKDHCSAPSKESSSGTKSVDSKTLLTKTSHPSSSPSKEAAQIMKMKQVKQTCNDDGSVISVSGSMSSSFQKKNRPNPSSNLTSGSKIFSSEGFESSHQKVSQFSQRFCKGQETHKCLEQESDSSTVSKERNSDGFTFFSKTFGNVSEESWEEEEDTSRRNRSEWASELFVQILSDDSGSSTAVDDNSLSSSKKYSSMLSSF